MKERVSKVKFRIKNEYEKLFLRNEQSRSISCSFNNRLAPSAGL